MTVQELLDELQLQIRTDRSIGEYVVTGFDGQSLDSVRVDEAYEQVILEPW